jgi:acetylornithine deacetylase
MSHTQLLADLVAIDSVNPDLVPGGAGEGAIAAFVAAWLEERGLEVEVVEPRRGRPSVVATARGSGGGRSLLLNAHLDTVGVVGMDAPHEPRFEDGRLYGRGAYDMKASLAAILLVAADVRTRGLRGDVVVTAVADEEVGSVGTEAVLERVRADAAVVVEPTELRVAVAHRGFEGFEIATRGVAAHGSRPDLGVDAIARMGPVLVALDALAARLAAGPAHPLVGAASAHASLIEGGQEFSSYPARCLLTGERRTIPGETRGQIEREVREVAGDHGEAQLTIGRAPFESDAEHPFVQLLAARAGESAPVGLPFWTDAALIAAAGIPTAVFGPAGEGAHAEVEWVDLASVERVRDVLREVAVAWCG